MPEALEQTIRVERGFSAAEVRAATINEEDRTVEVVWTSEHPVKRYSWDEGYYMEVLDMNPKSIRMDRFKAGMSLLDSHDNWSMKSRLGTVIPDSVRIEGKKGYARVKFSRGEDAETIFRDLLDGHPIQISVGYRIHKYEKTEGGDKQLPVLRATDWEPLELSVVPIPADPNAYSRSVEKKREEGYEVVLVRQGADETAADAASHTEIPMNKREAAKTLKGKELDVLALGAGLARNENETDEQLSKRLLEAYDAEDRARAESEAKARAAEEQATRSQQQVQQPAPQQDNSVNVADVARAAIENEKKRQSEIRSLARSAKIEDEAFVRAAVDGNTTVEEFRGQMLEHLIKREERSPTFPIVETRGMRDAQETMRRLAVNAQMFRNGLAPKLEDGANQYVSLSTVDLARELLMQRGENWRGSNVDVIKRSLHSTSDFPLILGEITRQTMMNAYTLEQETNTFQLIATRNVMPDLRDVKVLEMGNGPELELLTEKGEYRRGTVKESQESFGIAHYGKVIGLTEAMLINDQLGAFARVIANWGRVVARLEGNIVWNVILQNQVLRSDNTALFHTSHGNIAATGTALNEAALIAGRTAFRKMKDIDGQQISLAPQYLFVGTDNEVPAQKLIQGITSPNTTDQVVPQAIRSLQPVYESRIDGLSAKAFYLFASPQQTLGRGLQYSYLSGYEAPRTMERYGFDYDGVEYRLDHYFGAGLTDFRFGYYNPGN